MFLSEEKGFWSTPERKKTAGLSAKEKADLKATKTSASQQGKSNRIMNGNLLETDGGKLHKKRHMHFTVRISWTSIMRALNEI
jgi:hypothetical protein